VQTPIVKALLPTAADAARLADEFPTAHLDEDGTLFTVIIHGMDYREVLSRIRDWTRRTNVGPVLVTDEQGAEELLDSKGHRRRLRWSNVSPP
jgi:hypothetical protein